MRARIVGSPFNKKRDRAKRPLQIIHSDVCGPTDPETYDNKRYFLTCIDGCTHFCKVYLMKHKSKVADCLKKYINEAESHFNVRASCIRCDNGGEDKTNALTQWCHKKGIVLEYTIPYSPQLNGTSERMNRSIMEKARALIIGSKLDKSMWGEAVLTATYLLNKSPTTVTEVTPAEKWYGKRPDLTKLHVFGTKVYTKILRPLKKLDNRGQEGIFVGYHTNGYRIWNTETKKVYISRHVVFTNDEKLKKKTPSQQIIHLETDELLKEQENENHPEDKIENQNNEEDNENNADT
jgi:transposase InsO family protein